MHTHTQTHKTHQQFNQPTIQAKKLFELSDVKKKDEIVICSIAALF